MLKRDCAAHAQRVELFLVLPQLDIDDSGYNLPLEVAQLDFSAALSHLF